ncbi:MAG TPA: OadG family protein [Anaerolineaceae bacterium]|nr:OadG family protein [Anaerolineaceae bacterium]
MNPITQGLIITVIGMGLVFLIILLLWALMDFLVKITNDKPKQEEPVVVPQGFVENVEISSIAEGDSNRLQKIAAVAVAIALNLNRQTPIIKPQDSSSISAWQSSKRTQVLNQSAALLNRKSRGTTK